MIGESVERMWVAHPRTQNQHPENRGVGRPATQEDGSATDLVSVALILRTALQPVMDRYDYVIIDCPPSLGTVTKNGLRISTGYVIPTIPDVLSTWGIYQIVDNVERFSTDIGRQIPALGIIATKVQANNLHRRIIGDLRARRLGRFGEAGTLPQPPLFENSVPQTVALERAADVEADIRTFKGKYDGAYDALSGLTEEVMQICEKKKS
jgi:chromosome partitioning protein